MLDSRPSQEQQIELLVLEARMFECNEDRQRQSERLDAVEDLDSSCREAWAMRGDALLAAGREGEARAAFELAVGDWSDDAGAAVDAAILMKLGRIYLNQHQAQRAADGASLGGSSKEVFLRAARLCNWAAAWCGAGEAALRIGDRDDAEAALCEANTRDNYVRALRRLPWLFDANPPHRASPRLPCAERGGLGLAVPAVCHCDTVAGNGGSAGAGAGAEARPEEGPIAGRDRRRVHAAGQGAFGESAAVAVSSACAHHGCMA